MVADIRLVVMVAAGIGLMVFVGGCRNRAGGLC